MKKARRAAGERGPQKRPGARAARLRSASDQHAAWTVSGATTFGLFVLGGDAGAFRVGWGVTFVLAVSMLLLLQFFAPRHWNFGMMRELFTSGYHRLEVLAHTTLMFGGYYLGVCLDEAEWVSLKVVWAWLPVFLAGAVVLAESEGLFEGSETRSNG
jgi:hypothetical protein